MAIKTILNEV